MTTVLLWDSKRLLRVPFVIIELVLFLILYSLFGGKYSACRHATVVGDTMGAPFKIISGSPSTSSSN